MLICPRCQFENPDPNHFCQACGTSLVEKPCPACQAIVQWSDDRCDRCGTFTGTIRAAIVSGNPDAINLGDRYQLLESDSTVWRVLDRDPLKHLPLQAVPDCAKSYLSLQAYFHQVIPPIYEAWRQADADVLILEDRSTLPQLIDVMRQSKSLPLLQVLHWFYEMIDLWEALEPLQQRQSLLEPSNLRLDEDELLCLQRLYDDTMPTPELKNLGTLWQTLLTQQEQPRSTELHQLLTALQSDQITTREEMRSRLRAIAGQAPAPNDEITLDLSDEIMSDPRSFDSTPTPISDLDVPPEEAITLIPEPAQDSDSDDMPTVVLPMQLFSLDDAGKTDIGRQRSHNEDCFGIDTQISKVQLPGGTTLSARGLYVLCDGMGGHAGGEIASQLAVDTLRSYFKQHWQDPSGLPSLETIREGVQLANKAIYNVNQDGARSGSGRMGTTLVMLLIQNTEAAVAHVGDSRLYSYTRKQGLKQVTVDHEVGQREILRGVEPEIAYGRPDAYQLTQALGPRDEYFVNPDVQFFELVEDTILLLASDGLTDNDLLETYWQTYLDPLMSSQANLDRGVANLIELANQYNGHDNITAIAVRAKVRPNLESMR